MPTCIRDSSLSQKVIRRQMSCSQHTTLEERLDILEAYSARMRRSGYRRSFRRRILVSGLFGYANGVTRSRYPAGQPLQRDGAKGKHLRLDKLCGSANWFKLPRNPPVNIEPVNLRPGIKSSQKARQDDKEDLGDTDDMMTALFVPKTRGGALMKQLKEKEDEMRRWITNKVRVVEQAGTKLANLLSATNKEKVPCSRIQFTTCEDDRMAGRCYSYNLTYASICTLCERNGEVSQYVGETSRTIMERTLEHVADAVSSLERASHKGQMSLKLILKYSWRRMGTLTNSSR